MTSLEGADWLKDPALLAVFRTLTNAGGEARVAGGAVRNALLGQPIADIDIATTLRPEAVMAAGEAAGLGVHPTGLKHGTITLTADGRPFEVTTLRLDVATDGRRAAVQYTDDWAADAARRDFTMNALFCGADGAIFDYAGGLPDIARGRVRFVGQPSERIKEDYLRILRFFRFHACYGRGTLDAVGVRACVRLRHGLLILSAERVRRELFKLLAGPRAAAVLKTMLDGGILPLLLPDLADLAGFRGMARVDRVEGFTPDAALRLAMLVADPLALSDKLRLTNAEKDRFRHLAAAPALSPRLRDRERRAILHRLGGAGWRDAVRLAWARARGGAWRELFDFAAAHPPRAFPLRGQDLVDAGFEPGARIGRMLEALEDWWIAGDFEAGQAGLLERARKLGEGHD